MKSSDKENNFFQIVATALDYQCNVICSVYPYLGQFSILCTNKSEHFKYEIIGSKIESNIKKWEDFVNFLKKVPKKTYNSEIAINFVYFLLDNKISFNISSEIEGLSFKVESNPTIIVDQTSIYLENRKIITLEKIESYILIQHEKFW